MTIKIRENKEPLVDLRRSCPELIIDIYEKSRADKEKTLYARRTVAKMLQEASSFLPKGVKFTVRDAWRPQHVQEDIRDYFFTYFSRKHPAWDKKRIQREMNKFVASSKGKNSSGHMAGGAIDLRLWKKGRKIPMKSSKLSYQENAASHQPKLPAYIRRNRKIMFNALEKVGLSNNKNEYWHWSYGDSHWAIRTGKKIAKYGVVEEVNQFR